MNAEPVLYLVDDLAEGLAPAAHPFHRVSPGDPQISVFDLGVTRGDGVFEAAGVFKGVVQALDAHLARFARSAAMLDLPAPRLDVWADAIHAAVTDRDSDAYGFVKFIMTRGIEGSGVPTGWVYATDAEDHAHEHEHGIRVVALDRGVRHDVAKTSPWLLAGAKTLSYAVNKAALREAARRGADDVIFISSDSFVLEGPTSSVLLHDGEGFATPSLDQGILAGTTQAAAFDALRRLGHSVRYRQITADELPAAHGLWLLSSTRGAAPVVDLDGRVLPLQREITDALNAHLLTRTR